MRLGAVLLVAGCAAGLAALGCSNKVSTGSGGSGTTSSTGSSSTAASTSATGTSTSTGSTSTSSSTGSGMMAVAECATAADCKLQDDCCVCEAMPKTMSVAMCTVGCTQTQCAALGLTPMLSCQVGRCVAGFDCDASSVTCAAPAPMCNAGQVAAISNGCWTGKCVASNQCTFVPGCSACGQPNQACVYYGGGDKHYHCVDLPKECVGPGTCACMGQSVCGGVPCVGTPNNLTCQAP